MEIKTFPEGVQGLFSEHGIGPFISAEVLGFRVL